MDLWARVLSWWKNIPLISSPYRIFFKTEKIIPGHHHAYGPHRFGFLGSRGLWLFRLFVLFFHVWLEGEDPSLICGSVLLEKSLRIRHKNGMIVSWRTESTSYQALELSRADTMVTWSSLWKTAWTSSWRYPALWQCSVVLFSKPKSWENSNHVALQLRMQLMIIFITNYFYYSARYVHD